MELNRGERSEIFERTQEIVENYFAALDSATVLSSKSLGEIRNDLQKWDFTKPSTPLSALNFVAHGLTEAHLHTSHPAYFGVFNPRSTFMGVIGDTLTAAINPQLASHTSAPFAVELEDHLLRQFGEKFGIKNATGSFTSGGMEANHSAVLVALNKAFQDLSNSGLRTLKGQPVLYVSSEAHHSFLKAAKMCGLGAKAVREVPVDENLKLKSTALKQMIESDQASGLLPFLIVGTAGTTAAGIIDPLLEIAEIARQTSLWFHVDGAWGAAAVLAPELRNLFLGIEKADSITLDAHKWLNIPMGAGMLLCRNKIDLKNAFSISTSYMPQKIDDDLTQPYRESFQWSRRFIGLKLFLSLAFEGWDGYAQKISHQVAMGEQLREKIKERGWQIHNKTKLPVICFSPTKAPFEPSQAEELVSRVALSGKTWITTTKINGRTVLRAGIPNFMTQEKDLDSLMASLEEQKIILKIV